MAGLKDFDWTFIKKTIEQSQLLSNPIRNAISASNLYSAHNKQTIETFRKMNEPFAQMQALSKSILKSIELQSPAISRTYGLMGNINVSSSVFDSIKSSYSIMDSQFAGLTDSIKKVNNMLKSPEFASLDQASKYYTGSLAGLLVREQLTFRMSLQQISAMVTNHRPDYPGGLKLLQEPKLKTMSLFYDHLEKRNYDFLTTRPLSNNLISNSGFANADCLMSIPEYISVDDLEGERNVTREIVFEFGYKWLYNFLIELDKSVAEVMQGAYIALKSASSDNSEWYRHFSSSVRAAFMLIINRLSPVDKVKKKLGRDEKGNVTMKERVEYAFSEYFEKGKAAEKFRKYNELRLEACFQIYVISSKGDHEHSDVPNIETAKILWSSFISDLGLLLQAEGAEKERLI